MDGGAIANLANPASSLVINNSTFFGNGSDNGSGGAIFNSAGNLTLSSSILWGNAAGVQGNQIFNNGGVTSTLRASDVQGTGFSGVNGNIDQDPLFVSTAADSPDLRLQSTSPCINTGATADLPRDVLDLDGDNDTTEALPLDIDGAPRVRGSSVDMGAHEAP